jgi:2-phospho-L-lactate guanylyltransferase
MTEASQTDATGEGIWVLVPVKILSDSKQRLEARLGTNRAGFTEAMLTDVFEAMIASNTASHVAVVTADPTVSMIAGQKGFHVVKESGSAGMISAIERGIDAIGEWGGRRTAVLHADIPLITGAEFDRVIHEFERQTGDEERCIGLCPSADRNGTNCLIMDGHPGFSFCYGPDSYRLHVECAHNSGYRLISLYSPTISMDIDDEQDLEAMMLYCRQHPEFQETATWQYLLNNDLVG